MGGRLHETIKVFYLIHAYRPEFESVAKEIAFLRKSFPGELYEIDRLMIGGNRYSRRFNRIFPYLMDKACHINHIYFPRLIDFSRILYLSKPKIVTVVAKYLGYKNAEDMRDAIPIIEKMDQVITADEEEEEILHNRFMNMV